TDLVLFYVFWEAMLIPAYFLLWLFGEGSRPGWAALKFVLYTLAGSLLMLVGVIGEYIVTGRQTFDLSKLATLAPSPSMQFGLFFVFALAFAIKTPLFPFHSWLPDAYSAAPIPMLITFAGVMGKAGAYGFLRIAVPLFPQPVDWWDWRWVIPVLAVAAIIYGALMALVQRDMKLLVSYSSVSHMGFIVLGIFAFNIQGQQAAVGLVLTPVYMLRLFQGVTQGAPAGPVPRSDIYAGQLTVLAPLVALMFAIGLDPGVLTGLMTSLGQAGLYR